MVTKKATAKKTPAATPAKTVTPVAVKPKHMAPHDIVLSSNTQNAIGILAWSKFAGEADLQALVNDLGEQTKNVQAGDMRPVEGMLYRLDRLLAELPHSLAMVEWVLRPAVVDLDGAVAEGFATTMYVKAVGVDEGEATERWDAALREVAALLRSRELASY